MSLYQAMTYYQAPAPPNPRNRETITERPQPHITVAHMDQALAADLAERGTGLGAAAYRHIPGGPISDQWWLRYGLITDLPYPEETP